MNWKRRWQRRQQKWKTDLIQAARIQHTHTHVKEREWIIWPSIHPRHFCCTFLLYSCWATHFRAHVTISPWYSKICLVSARVWLLCVWMNNKTCYRYLHRLLLLFHQEVFQRAIISDRNRIRLTVAGILVSIARSVLRQFMYRSIDSLYFNDIYAPTTMITTTTTTCSKSILDVPHRCYRYAFDVLFSTFLIVYRRTPTSTHHTNALISMRLSSILTPTFMYRD